MDEQTKAIQKEAKLLEELIKHEGYQIAKRKLMEKVHSMINIHNLDMNVSPETLTIEVKARQKANELILDWFNLDIEGTVQQAKNNLGDLTLNEMPFIVREE